MVWCMLLLGCQFTFGIAFEFIKQHAIRWFCYKKGDFVTPSCLTDNYVMYICIWRLTMLSDWNIWWLDNWGRNHYHHISPHFCGWDSWSMYNTSHLSGWTHGKQVKQMAFESWTAWHLSCMLKHMSSFFDNGKEISHLFVETYETAIITRTPCNNTKKETKLSSIITTYTTGRNQMRHHHYISHREK